jgi:hypothetical protein
MKVVRPTAKRRRRRRGVLTFEWILLISLLVIGIIGGLSAVRNALICELSDLANCIEALNVCGCPDAGDMGQTPPGAPPWWCWECNQ